jgi:hypothetical protein
MLVHADSEVVEEQWEMTDDRKTSGSEGMKSATTVWK